MPYEFQQAMERSTSERDQEVERQRARLVLSNSTSSSASAASPRKWNQYQEQKKNEIIKNGEALSASLLTSSLLTSSSNSNRQYETNRGRSSRNDSSPRNNRNNRNDRNDRNEDQRKQKPEWIPAIDTSLNQKNKKKDIQKKKKNSRSKSNSPSSFRTERRNTPLRNSRSRSRSPAASTHSPKPHEIVKGTFWGLYSDAEAKRKKTEEYYENMRNEEDKIAKEQEMNMLISPNNSPKSARKHVVDQEKEDLYRQLRG